MMKRTVLTALALILTLILLPTASKAAPLGKFSWRVEYYNNAGLSGQPANVRFEDAVSHQWGSGSPGLDIRSDHFSARWTVTRHFEAGTYLFLLDVDDGARVWLNGQLIIDAWNLGQKTKLKKELYLEEGDQQLQVAYFENTGNASINLEWLTLGGEDDFVGAWNAEYFTNRYLEGSPVLVRQEGSINYDWNSGSPDPRVTRDNFSVRWTNTLYLRSGYYRLRIQHDDGMRIFVDGQSVYDAWYDQGVSYQTRERYLNEGNHTFVVEYYEHLGNAIAAMSIDGDLNSSSNSSSPQQAHRPHHNDYHNNMSYYNDQQPTWNSNNYYNNRPPSNFDATQYGPASNDFIIISQEGDNFIEQVTVIDNMNPGFRWGGTPNNRRPADGGYNTGFFWTYNTGTIPVDFGEWRPNLKAGQYEVFVFIPGRHATTRNARYQVFHNGGQQTDRVIDQSFYSDEWVSLGAFYFDGSSTELVRLYDGTGEVYGSTYIAYDAIKFVPR